jgi:prolyl-tRNA synthetase
LNWVRRGAPLIVEIGPRDAAGDQVTYMRRDRLRDGDKVKSIGMARQDFLENAVQLLSEIQAGLYAEAKARLDANIASGVTDWAGVEEFFGTDDDSFKGWLRVAWSKPTGAALEAVDARLKTLKLTIRNAPLDQPDTFAPCLFTGQPGVEEILIGRAY